MSIFDNDLVEEILRKLTVDLATEGIKKAAKEIIRISKESKTTTSLRIIEEPLKKIAMSKDLELEGQMGYSISNSSVEIRAEKIVNSRRGGHSGTLRLSIWATETKYTGGTLRGQVIASCQLDSLEGGYHYNNVKKTTSYIEPRGGYYYLTLILEEYNSQSEDHWPMMDHMAFDERLFLGKALVLDGDIAYSIKGSILQLKIGRISNKKITGKSRILRLTCWATENRYEGGGIEGYVLGRKLLPALEGGYGYTDIEPSMEYVEPTSGEYCITVTLEEFDLEEYDSNKDVRNNWTIRDYTRFEKRIFLGKELLLEGLSYSLSRAESTIELTITKLTNKRKRQKSGQLQLTLMAIDTPYDGGRIEGYIFAKEEFAPLKSGESYEDMTCSVTYKEPPEGEYYVAGFIEEYDQERNDWITKDHIVFDNKLYTDGIGNLPFNGLFAMFGKFAKADGIITKEEVQVVKDILNLFEPDKGDREKAIQSFNDAKNSSIPFGKFIRKIYRKSQDENFVKMILDFLFIIAKTCKRFHIEHERLILEATEIFHIQSEIYKEIKGKYYPDNSQYYAILECTPQDSNEQIKLQYRKLVKQYHVDRHHHKDLTEDERKELNKRFQEIKTAYEIIKEERGLDEKRASNTVEHDPHKYVLECRICQGILRVPSDRGLIKVSCPHCDFRFYYNTSMNIYGRDYEWIDTNSENREDEINNLISKSLEFLEQKDYQQALLYAEKVIEIQSDHVNAWVNRGTSLLNLKRYDEALTAYNEVLLIDLGEYIGVYNKACVYSLQGKTELAIKNLEIAIQMNSNSREMAKTDSDFDRIRHEKRFQNLLNGN